jgi:TATA-box binding protein (TBP) (component of TFIID and TFIIIB)
MDFDIDNEWQLFLDTNEIKDEPSVYTEPVLDGTPPETDPLYISTKSLINYISTSININTLFWKIPISMYSTPTECIIKKQMKFTTFSMDELTDIQHKLSFETAHIEEQINYTINNPTGRIKFKDVRKISVGISKRDMLSNKCKKIGAFYNCLAIIVRIRMPDELKFREMHVKLFNTGKLEIPGIQSTRHGEYILYKILDILNSAICPTVPITVQVDQSEIVLINSNFNCNFYINRDVLFDKLQKKYSVKCIYDPCSYPGIQCKYTIRPGSEVSYMIFRTGSVLIVGKCSELDIYTIYEYVKNILVSEYAFINQPINPQDSVGNAQKHKKIRTKTIHFYDI